MPCPYGVVMKRSCSSHRGVVTTKKTAGAEPALVKVCTVPAGMRMTAPVLT